MKPNTKKNRKNKIKEKYSRKYGGSTPGVPPGPPGPPPGPPPAGSESPEALKLIEESRKVEEEAAKRKAESTISSGTGLTEKLKAVQSELFTKLNGLNDDEISNLTTPMINAVKRLSSKPSEELEDAGTDEITIDEEIDRFLVSLFNAKENILASQIYYIDQLLHEYNSTSITKGFKPVSSEKLLPFDDEKYMTLRRIVQETQDFPDTSNRFIENLIKMMGNIDLHRISKVTNKSVLRSKESVITVPNKNVKITSAAYTK